MVLTDILKTIKSLYLLTGISQADTARQLNMSPQMLNSRIKRIANNNVWDYMSDICNLLGYDIEINMIDRKTGNKISIPVQRQTQEQDNKPV